MLLLVLVSLISTGLCMPGGWSEVKDDALKAEFLGILTQEEGKLVTLGLDYNVTKIESQVVAGRNIRYTIQMKDATCTMTIFDQPWTQTRQVLANTCTHMHNRRAGGYSVVTDESLKQDYLALLSSVQSSNLLSLDAYQVVKIESQVVAGVNVKYTLHTAAGTCSVTIFSQVWTHTQKVTDNTCAPKAVRQLGGGFMAGGYSVVTDEALKQEYLTLLSSVQSSNLLSLDAYQVVKMESQVVAGVNVKYTLHTAAGTCSVTIFSQVWTHTQKVTDNTCAPKAVRQLGGGFMAGGYSVVTDPKLLEDYKLKLTSLVGTNQQYTIQKIESQVVAGLNIKYTITSSQGTCEIIVFSQVWTQTLQINKNTCTASNKRQLLGGYNDVDVNDPMVQKCLGMSLDKVNQMSNSMFRLVQTNIVSAKQQVVAGMNYAVTFQTGPSTCMNSAEKMGMMAGDCPVNANSMMTQNTWTAHCYRSLAGDLSFSSVDMELATDNQLDNDLNLDLKPVSIAKSKIATATGGMLGSAKNTILKGKLLQKGDDRPVVNLLRKKRNVNFLVEKLDKIKSYGNAEDLDNILEQGKALLGGGDNHDLVNHVKDILGQDGHDMIKHAGEILGGDGHDLIAHGKKLLGGDGHDLIAHGKKLLGGDGHDLIAHGKKLIGRDGHDLIAHGNNLIGGDDHDLVPHGNSLIGGDDHDLVPHGNNLIGGDDHDLVPHGNNLIGGDDHDLVPHGKKLIGGDGHDLVPHGKKLIGGDGHDQIKHGQKILGGDDHDLKFHGSKNKKLLGGDGHDYCHIGMFNEFKAKFNKLYGSQKEEEKRFEQFCINMRMARKIQQTEKGTAIYGATKFADLTREEFQQYVGKRWDITASEGMKKAAIPKGQAPDSFDWREHNAVTPVKNQGSCGSCWAFSTTGNIEGQWAIKKKNLISLSEQELVDCDKVDEGCNGGLPSQAYKEIERLGGLETEADYSYKGEDEKCVFKKKDVKVYINDSVSISSDEAEMASWLAANGPISIGINAFAMQFYMGGISHPWKIFCNPKNLDHGVLIVGYGVQDNKPYWIVKNSWGPDWGEKGYYLVYRGDGVCGLNTMCTSAVVN